MNSNKNIFKGFLSILLSNGIILISNIITGLVIPKLLGVNNYGYYKIYTLYLGYAPLLHMGFVDGILLKHGNEDFEKLNREQFRANTAFFSFMQLLISIIIIIFSLFFLEHVYKYIFVMVGIDIAITNISSYFQYISQCTMRFNELSFRRLLQSFLKILLVFICYAFFKENSSSGMSVYYYVSALVFIDFCLLIWYVFTYSDISFGKRERLCSAKNRIIAYFKAGVIVTIAFQLSNIIFSLDRQFVSMLFNTYVFGTYSFAYSLISMATAVISAISLVLFPSLKRKSKDSIVADFSDSIAMVSSLVFFSLLGYFPLSAFIRWYLPNYIDSLVYLRIIFPGLALSSCITTIIFTYYKVLNETVRYFRICVCIAILSFVLNVVLYLIFRTPTSISWASIVSLLIWFGVGNRYFVHVFKVDWGSNFLYIIIMMIIFYLFSASISLLSIIGYLFSFVLITVLIQKTTIKRVMKFLYKRKIHFV